MLLLKNLTTAAAIAESRDDLIRFADLLARPQEKHDDVRLRRNPGDMFKAGSVPGTIEVHPELVPFITSAVLARIMHRANLGAQRYFDEEVQRLGQQLVELGVKIN